MGIGRLQAAHACVDHKMRSAVCPPRELLRGAVWLPASVRCVNGSVVWVMKPDHVAYGKESGRASNERLCLRRGVRKGKQRAAPAA